MRAAIDVGTNTVRLLLGEVRAGRVIPERYCRRVTRLGGGLTAAGLAPEAMQRTLIALRDFSPIISKAGVGQVRAVGTEVLRAAGNAADFLRLVEQETGIVVEIIDGEQEARLTATGVLGALDPRPVQCLIVDIGGGSTEFILWRNGRTLLQHSYPLGAVRLAEDYGGPEKWQARIEELLLGYRAEIEKNDLLGIVCSPDCRLVGTAGTVTTLAALHLQMTDYDWRRVNNLVLQKSRLLELQARLEPLSPADREKLPGMEKGRGDLIVPGLQILLSVLDLFSFDRLTVSDFGLIEGILLDAHEYGRQYN